jgi:hypothetical protein
MLPCLNFFFVFFGLILWNVQAKNGAEQAASQSSNASACEYGRNWADCNQANSRKRERDCRTCNSSQEATSASADHTAQSRAFCERITYYMNMEIRSFKVLKTSFIRHQDTDLLFGYNLAPSSAGTRVRQHCNR